MIQEHFVRWAPHFSTATWWPMYQALYEGPGHDWEGADVALEEMAYELAKARGIDTSQTCPECKQVVDEPRTLGRWRSCVSCLAAEEARHEEAQRAEAARRAAHDLWLASLSPEEREAYLAEQQQATTFMVDGLVARDVQ